MTRGRPAKPARAVGWLDLHAREGGPGVSVRADRIDAIVDLDPASGGGARSDLCFSSGATQGVWEGRAEILALIREAVG